MQKGISQRRISKRYEDARRKSDREHYMATRKGGYATDPNYVEVVMEKYK